MTEHIDQAIKAGLDTITAQLPDARIIVLVADDTGDGFGGRGYRHALEMRDSLDKHAATVDRAVSRAERDHVSRN
jgi:hypothetical protein